MQVRQERTNWRDSTLNDVHYLENLHLPLKDLGFLVLEYDHGKPIALINYEKYEKPISSDYTKSIKVIQNLGNSLTPKIPVFDVRYSYVKDLDIIDKFKITPINDIAKTKIAHIEDYVILTEEDFIYFLYSLRNSFEKGMFIAAKLKEKNWKLDFKEKETQWEHEIISHRHREYGWDVPVVDIDFIYSKDGIPISLVEYKEDKSYFDLDKNINHPTIQALSLLADKSSYKLPFFLVRYKLTTNDIDKFYISPINKKSKDIISTTIELDKSKYFSFINDLSLKSSNETKPKKMCPKCNSELIKKINSKTGINFYGCSNYPDCTYSENI